MHADLSSLLAGALAQRTPPRSADGSGPIPPLQRGGSLESSSLLAIAKAYLFAELETAGLIVCADAVAELRSQLRTSYEFMQRIEAYAQLQRQSPTTLEREAFFVHWFGLGRHAAMDERGNHAFFPLLSELCGALAATAQRSPAGSVRSFSDERARGALQRLLLQLSHASGGNLAIVANIERLAAAAVALLSEPDLATLLGAHDFAGVIDALVGGVAQDLRVAYQRGRFGQAVLEDCVRLRPGLSSNVALVESTEPAIAHATHWLASYGLIRGGA